jgi:hypothetical protein
MRLRTLALLVASHVAVGIAGFAAGIYVLPLLIAPPAPTVAEVERAAEKAAFRARFERDLPGSDALHWGEGEIAVGRESIALSGRVAPGPDYKLYLSPEYVETRADFLRLKAQMVRVGDVRTFENFVVPVPASIDPANYRAVIVWCETFGQFITAARYR